MYPWSTLKLYLSSTCKNNELEPDALAGIFNKITTEFARKHLHFSAYDFRCRDHCEHKKIKSRIEVLDECQYFVGVINDYYGCRPSITWQGNTNIHGLSIAEMEIEYALKNIEHHRRFFLFGDKSQCGYRTLMENVLLDRTGVKELKDSLEKQKVVYDINQFGSVDKLKNKLLHRREKIYDFQSIRELLAFLEEKIIRIITADYSSGAIITADEIYNKKKALPDLPEKNSIISSKYLEDREKKIFLKSCQNLALKLGEKNLWNYLGFIAASREGMKDCEIKELMKQTCADITDDLYFDLVRSLEDFITNRQGILAFAHPKLKSMVKEQLDSKSSMKLYHRRLSFYFMMKGTNYPRTLRELIYQLQYAQLQGATLRILTDIKFLMAKVEAEMLEDLVADFERALNNSTVRIPQFAEIFVQDNIKVSRNTLHILHKALQMDRSFISEYPELLFQCLWNRCYWHDSTECAPHYHKNAGNIPIGEENSNKLSLLVESWRFEVEKATKTIWLKAIRPLNSTSDSIHHRLLGHEKSVTALTYSFDGKRLASGSDDKTVRIWNSENGQCLLTLTGHESSVIKLCFSADREILASGSKDKTARIWNSENGQCLFTLKDHKDAVHQLYFSPDGKKLATGSLDNTVRIWDCKSGKCLSVLTGHESLINSIYYSPDGKQIATSAQDNTVKIRNIANEKNVLILKGHQSFVFSLQYSPDGKKLASGSWDATVRIWDTTSGECLLVLESHIYPIHCISFSPDGKKLASGSSDNTVRIWDCGSGECLLILKDHEDSVDKISFSPDGKRITTISDQNTLQIWDAASGERLFVFESYDDYCLNGYYSSSRSYSPDGEHVACYSMGHIVRIWDAFSGKCRKVVESQNKACDFFKQSPRKKIYALADFAKTEIKNNHGLPIAYFPEAMENIDTTLCGKIAGSIESNVIVLQLCNYQPSSISNKMSSIITEIL